MEMENDELDMDGAPLVQDAPEAAVPAPSIDEAIAAAMEKVSADQPRDEAGRFATKIIDEQPTPEQAAKAALETEQAAKEPVQQDTVAPIAAVPESWAKDKAALFVKANPELQAYIRQREEQISRGFARYSGLAEFAQHAEANGNTLRDVLVEVQQIEHAFETDPAGTLMALARRFNISNEQIAATLNGQPVQSAAPAQRVLPQAPHVDVERLVDSRLAQRQTEQEVASFFADPANKHAETVAGPMAALLRADRNLSIKDAYEQAVWAHPQVRAELLKEQTAKAQAEQAKQVREQTQNAQRAAKSLTGGSASAASTAQPKAMTVEESIAHAVAQHGG